MDLDSGLSLKLTKRRFTIAGLSTRYRRRANHVGSCCWDMVTGVSVGQARRLVKHLKARGFITEQGMIEGPLSDLY